MSSISLVLNVTDSDKYDEEDGEKLRINESYRASSSEKRQSMEQLPGRSDQHPFHISPLYHQMVMSNICQSLCTFITCICIICHDCHDDHHHDGYNEGDGGGVAFYLNRQMVFVREKSEPTLGFP